MMPHAITPMNPRKRDHDDEIETIDRSLKSARLDSSDQLTMFISQANIMQPTLSSNPVHTYGPASLSYPIYQSMTAVTGPSLNLSMPSQLLPNDGQGPMMPAGLLTTMPHALSHESMAQVFDGSDLTLDPDHSSSPYFSNTSPIDESSLMSPTVQRGLDGFPSPRAFDELLDDYITSLSPKKRDKALIPQKRYDNILRVLRDPKCTTIESAQFRFWAKKMFKLGSTDQSSMAEIVTHEGKPVAVREDLYRVLTNAHGACQHGGRDKTSAQVRRNYSWVPKELIARFVRNCPTCAMRRNPLGSEAVMRSGLGTMPNNDPQHLHHHHHHHHQPPPYQPQHHHHHHHQGLQLATHHAHPHHVWI